MIGLTRSLQLLHLFRSFRCDAEYPISAVLTLKNLDSVNILRQARDMLRQPHLVLVLAYEWLRLILELPMRPLVHVPHVLHTVSRRY